MNQVSNIVVIREIIIATQDVYVRDQLVIGTDKMYRIFRNIIR